MNFKKLLIVFVFIVIFGLCISYVVSEETKIDDSKKNEDAPVDSSAGDEEEVDEDDTAVLFGDVFSDRSSDSTDDDVDDEHEESTGAETPAVNPPAEGSKDTKGSNAHSTSTISTESKKN